MTATTSLARFAPRVRGIVAYAAGPALGVLSGPILAHALGPVGRGQFASVMEPLTVAGAVASMGIPAAVTYYVARRESDPHRTYRLGVLVAVVPALGVFAFMIWYSGEVARAQGLPRWVYLAAWAVLLLSAVVQIRRGLWHGRAVWARLDAERLTFAVLRFAGVAAVALCGISFVGSYVGAALLAFVIAALILWLPSRSPVPRAPHRPRLAGFVGYSMSASLGTISVVANNRLDQVLMPAQTSSAEVGFYAVAVTVAEVPLVLAVLAARNALQLASAGRPLTTILRDIALFMVTGVILGVLLAVFAGLYLPLVFGAAFEPSVVPVQVLSLASILSIVLVVVTAIVSGRGRPGLASLVPVAGLATTIVAFVLDWRGIGALDAATIAVFSQVASALVAIPVFLVAGRTPHTVPDGDVYESEAVE